MLALLQRVTHADVHVNKKIIGEIQSGILVFLAVEREDQQKNADRLLERILSYRVFGDENDRMNLSVKDVQGGLLLIPQFTLAADTRSGTRPGFSKAAPPQLGEDLFKYFVEQAQSKYSSIATGQFGAYMQINLCNDGPTTFLLQA
ncbi:MAG: D-aminoacyl-tRNA deacylase [Pseudomonadota bacterium]|nr:D-tyrosyl-tRNA(Tyr) deacylase [Gammaproteobacteria bacterium]MBU1558651.1 D-tyrosyl-tRNA(Tyr) deacylase [Gammaproteobacteria bacterium]MBU1926835.1 D-tyrosyl-tRNA(Tyr) deacylase [Gammaproteobacteria bacterium]MBU2546168.1 D-tyrosyl-tRNA(Tyr) deacylase [Gammaproteobacteria bacterium]